MKSIMLDTNAYSSYCRGNEDVLEALARADRVFMSVFVTYGSQLIVFSWASPW